MQASLSALPRPLGDELAEAPPLVSAEHSMAWLLVAWAAVTGAWRRGNGALESAPWSTPEAILWQRLRVARHGLEVLPNAESLRRAVVRRPKTSRRIVKPTPVPGEQITGEKVLGTTLLPSKVILTRLLATVVAIAY